MRCFFALWPEPQTQSALERWGSRWAEAAGGRPASGGSAHLTLAFLGELERDGAEVARAREAAAACPFTAFTLSVEHGGWFRAKRLGWLAPGTVPQGLLDLAAALRTALAARDVRFDPQPFVPHITVLRRAQRLESAPAAAPIVWAVASFALMASVPQGARGHAEGRSKGPVRVAQGNGLASDQQRSGRSYQRIGEWGTAGCRASSAADFPYN